MSQSKRHSAVETASNTAVGFVGSYFITFACFHVPGADLATKTLYATLGCTVWSLLRGYYLRRFFNHLHTKQVQEANADPLAGWKVDWESPFEADFVPCTESADGYHSWPLHSTERKCLHCGVATGKRVGNVLAQPEFSAACDCNQGRLPCTCKEPVVEAPCRHLFVDGFGGMGDALTCCKCGLSKYPEALPAGVLELAYRQNRVIPTNHPEYNHYADLARAATRKH